jgi:uncharacterized membrane protein YkoI
MPPTTPEPETTTPPPTTPEPTPLSTPPITPEPTPEPTRLTRDEALQIALNFAGVTRNQIDDLDIELGRRGGRVVWEVEFEVDERGADDDWDFYIDIYTGEILHWERD